MLIIIRKTTSTDYDRWFALWTGYCLFYGNPPDADVVIGRVVHFIDCRHPLQVVIRLPRRDDKEANRDDWRD
jgi:hypothetical protein